MINLNEIAFIDKDGFDFNDGESLIRFDVVAYCPDTKQITLAKSCVRFLLFRFLLYCLCSFVVYSFLFLPFPNFINSINGKLAISLLLQKNFPVISNYFFKPEEFFRLRVLFLFTEREIKNVS